MFMSILYQHPLLLWVEVAFSLSNGDFVHFGVFKAARAVEQRDA